MHLALKGRSRWRGGVGNGRDDNLIDITTSYDVTGAVTNAITSLVAGRRYITRRTSKVPSFFHVEKCSIAVLQRLWSIRDSVGEGGWEGGGDGGGETMWLAFSGRVDSGREMI